MRTPILAPFLALALVSAAAAAQRSATAPAIPPHAVPPRPAAPVAGHASSPHVPPVVHPPASAHPGTHTGPSPKKPVPPHNPAGYPVSPVGTVSGIGSTNQNRFNSQGVLPNKSLRRECAGGPGFGFDYTHFFAVHPECNNVAFGGFALPFVSGEFYVPMTYYAETAPEEQAAASPIRDSSPTSEETSVAKETETQPREDTYAALKPVNEYVFVKRDGTRVFAVAYSLLKDKIQYVTKEGLRRTLVLDSLDFDETEKSNEDRGNTVNLPKPVASSVV